MPVIKNADDEDVPPLVSVAEEIEATREEALGKIGNVKPEGDARQRVSHQQFGEKDAHPSRRNAA